MYPAPLASGKQLAVLYVRRDASDVGRHRPDRRRREEADLPDVDEGVSRGQRTWCRRTSTLKADDGVEFHNQLFLPKDLKPGERRPAIVFVHGGPIRQMLLGYHYMDFYHWAYGVNQWLASQGYVVMSVNYRSGVGYGKSFRTAPNTGGRGNAEYHDVLAAGKYLQARADVDPARVGIWGLSYGGVLTAQALARNSDIFVAGVDMAGVHLWGSSLDTADVSYKSSAISRDRRMEVAGVHLARRRRSQRRLLADDRPRQSAARAKRLLRADRHPRRHARDAAAQPLARDVRPHGQVPR